MAAEKISVSLQKDDVMWLRRRARANRASLSSTVAEATRLLRQQEARESLLRDFSDVAEVSAQQAEAIRAQWRG